MTDVTVQRFYRFHAHVYDGTRWLILHRRRQAVAALNLRPNGHVLEVGCGTGLSFRYILAHLDPRGGTLTGLDFSPHMLERARRRVVARGWANVTLLRGDATSMDLGRRFDAVLLAYSLTMIGDYAAALRRAREHLEPGGTLVVLDFGRFEKWGPLGPLIRGWLRLNHVETLRPYVQELGRLFGRVELYRWLGGYSFIAVARKER